MDPYAEKRQFVRLNVLTDVTYAKVASPQDEGLSISKNISMGGICLIVYEKLNVGDVVLLNIVLPDNLASIPSHGRVVWIREFIIGDPVKGKRYDSGIEFLDISEENRNRINKYVFRRQ